MLHCLSFTVGLGELEQVYREVRRIAGEDHIPIRMIDLCIRLEHFAQIPERDVEDLKKRLMGNPVAYTALRLLVNEFLHLFPVDFRLRQRMAKLLDFDVTSPKLLGDKIVRKMPSS